MLLANETITLFRLRKTPNEDVYDRWVLHGASWYATSMVVLDTLQQSKGIHAQNVFKVRLPPETDPAPQIGDLLARGEISPITRKEELADQDWFIVKTVGDNRRGRLQHWRVTGA